MQPTTKPLFRDDEDAWRDQMVALEFAFVLRKPYAIEMAERYLYLCRQDAGIRTVRDDRGTRIVLVPTRPDVKVLAERRALEVVAIIEGHTKAVPHNLRNLYDWTERGEGAMVLARNTDMGPTPEALAMQRRPSRMPPIPKLFESGHIDAGQVRAAQEIQWVAEAITTKLDARSGSYSPGGAGGGFWQDNVAEKVSNVYVTYIDWAKSQKMRQAEGTRHLGLCLAVIVASEPVRDARARFKMGHPKAVAYLQRGLSDYRAAQVERQREEERARRQLA